MHISNVGGGAVPASRIARTMSMCSAVLLGLGLSGLGLLAAGVASAGQSCTHTIRGVEDARAALNTAAPGDMLCFLGADLADVDLTMTRSGTADAPISLVSDGRTTIHQLHILADHVVIQGFTITGGGELLLEGTGIIAQKNTVRDTQRGGIVCASCIDSIIESNTVTRAATTGISITGQRVTVRENLVIATVPVEDSDADGIRFFGNGHRIISNIIRDIPASGSAHPDCFQTFDTGHPPTFDVEIVGNNCQNVAENCLIATGDESGNGEAPVGSRSVTFIGNTCTTNGDQAVILRHWPRADVRKNTLLGPNLKRGVLITTGSTGCTAKDNTTAADVPPVEIDDSSRPGFNNPF
ncbi:MAG: right-handed parallel beta-helix repeat-containing protein [Pseudonocardiaceae bacterium]